MTTEELYRLNLEHFGPEAVAWAKARHTDPKPMTHADRYHSGRACVRPCIFDRSPVPDAGPDLPAPMGA